MNKLEFSHETIPINVFEVPKLKIEFRQDEFVNNCPNDNTRLEGYGWVHYSPGKEDYTETAKCPKCGYLVSRRPSDKTIERVRQSRKKVLSFIAC